MALNTHWVPEAITSEKKKARIRAVTNSELFVVTIGGGKTLHNSCWVNPKLAQNPQVNWFELLKKFYQVSTVHSLILTSAQH